MGNFSLCCVTAGIVKDVFVECWAFLVERFWSEFIPSSGGSTV